MPMIKKRARPPPRNPPIRAGRNIRHLIPKFISLIAVTALSICGGRCAAAVDETQRRASDHSGDRAAWDKLLSNIGQVRKARKMESPPISTDGLIHTSWNLIVTIYGSDGSLRDIPCGILPYTDGCRPESVRSCWD